MKTTFARRQLCICASALLLLAAPASAEQQPAAWASHRPLADWISTGFVVGQASMETWTNLHAPHRRQALLCQGLRTAIVVGAAEASKALVSRTRPDGSDAKSFFSEHTALTAVHSGWSFQIGIPITFGAGYGRAAAAKHYWSDIAVGAVTGFLARTVCR